MAKLKTSRTLPILSVVVMIAGSNCDSTLGVVTPRRYPFAAIGLIDESPDQHSPDQLGREPLKNKGCIDSGDGGAVEIKDGKPSCGCCCCGCNKSSSKPDAGTSPPNPGPRANGAPPAKPAGAEQSKCKQQEALIHEYHIYLTLGGQGQLPLVVSNNVADAGLSKVNAGTSAAVDAGEFADIGSGDIAPADAGRSADARQGMNNTKEDSRFQEKIQVIHYQSTNDAPAIFVVNSNIHEKSEKVDERKVTVEAIVHIIESICKSWIVMCNSIHAIEGCSFCSALEFIKIVLMFLANVSLVFGKTGVGVYTVSLVHDKLKGLSFGDLKGFFARVFAGKSGVKEDEEHSKPLTTHPDARINDYFKADEWNRELSRRLGFYVPQASAQALVELMTKHEIEFKLADWKKAGKYIRFEGNKIEIKTAWWMTFIYWLDRLLALALYTLATLLFIAAIISLQVNSLSVSLIVVGSLIIGFASMVSNSVNSFRTAQRIGAAINPRPPLAAGGVS